MMMTSLEKRQQTKMIEKSKTSMMTALLSRCQSNRAMQTEEMLKMKTITLTMTISSQVKIPQIVRARPVKMIIDSIRCRSRAIKRRMKTNLSISKTKTTLMKMTSMLTGTE